MIADLSKVASVRSIEAGDRPDLRIGTSELSHLGNRCNSGAVHGVSKLVSRSGIEDVVRGLLDLTVSIRDNSGSK